MPGIVGSVGSSGASMPGIVRSVGSSGASMPGIVRYVGSSGASMPGIVRYVLGMTDRCHFSVIGSDIEVDQQLLCQCGST